MSSLRSKYQRRFDAVLTPAARKLEALLTDYISGSDPLPHIDRIGSRPKSVARFLEKAGKKGKKAGSLKYDDPLGQIQDQIGARVIVFYRDDIPRVRERIERYFQPAELKSKEPQKSAEFGYFGFHYILMLPDDVVPANAQPKDTPAFFELQIRTLFQHAWSEGGHDMAYKAPRKLTKEEKRLLAYSSASAWGADKAMQDLFDAIVAGKKPS